MTSDMKSKWLKFLGGFVGWFLVSTGVLALSKGELGPWLIYLPVNVLVMLALAFGNRTKWISLGIVSAMAVNFLIALVLRPAYEAICFIPITYPRPSTRPISTPTPVNHLPEGFHDGNSGRVRQADCVAFGWAVDPDDRGEDVNVRVLLDGEVVAEKVASVYRPDLNVPNGCSRGTCGYLFELWPLISRDQKHTIRIQAQDLQTDLWKDLSNTPKTLDCGN